MFSILDVIGFVLRSAAALGLAAFCGWSSMFFGVFSGTGSATLAALSGQGGQMALLVMGAIGIFAGFYCLLSLSRETRRREAIKAIHDQRDGFDPDAIIARHLASRAASPPAAARPQNGFHQPPRRSFGRRVS